MRDPAIQTFLDACEAELARCTGPAAVAAAEMIRRWQTPAEATGAADLLPVCAGIPAPTTALGRAFAPLAPRLAWARRGSAKPGEAWYDRLRWMEHAGDRWWPILGGVYFIEAVKRVRGVRMIQPRWKVAKQARSTVPLAQGERHATHCAPPSAPPSAPPPRTRP